MIPGRTTVSQIGEMALIGKIRRWLRHPLKNKKLSILADIGDDAFVAKLSSNSPLVVTTDTLIEDTHFNLKWLFACLNQKETWFSLGYKAIAVNLSDLAAMGHVDPLAALVTLGLNGDISVDSVDNLYTGMKKLMKKYNFPIAGGDIIHSEKSIISVTLLGKLCSIKPINRRGASPGELLMCSGPLGLSWAGLKILKKQEKYKHISLGKLIEAHLYPVPKIHEGKMLSDRAIMATSALDTSDDLMTSLEILRDASGVGFNLDLDLIPIHPLLSKASQALKVSSYELLLYGGEDYQLLFTVPPSKATNAIKKIPGAYVLGKVLPKKSGIRIRIGGKPASFKESRFKHF